MLDPHLDPRSLSPYYGDVNDDNSPMNESDQSVVPSANEEEPAQSPRFGTVKRIRRTLHKKCPSFFSDPDFPEALAFWLARDAQTNAETVPPPEEAIDLRCIWVVEFYTPSHIDNLLTNLTRLGWDKHDDYLPDRNPAQWVRNLREQPHGGGWLNLGMIQKPGAPRTLPLSRTAPLPPSVEYAHGKIFSLTSSITCVVIGFVLNEKTSREYDRALNRTYETVPERARFGYQFYDPYSQKQKAIETTSARLRAEGAAWFKNHIPGLFAAGHLGGVFPTCEFLTLRRSQPFPKRENDQPDPGKYLGLLNMDSDLEAWRSLAVDGFRISLGRPRTREDKFHVIAAIAECDFNEDKLRMYGGLDRSSVAYYFNECMDEMLGWWALLPLLSGYEHHLSAVRDSATSRASGSKTALQVLRVLQMLVLQGADIVSVASELKHVARPGGSFLRRAGKFEPCDPSLYRREGITLNELLREEVETRAGWLEQAERSARDLLIQHANILGTQENVRLQQTMKRLTIFIAMLTLVTVWLAADKHLKSTIAWLSGMVGH